MCGPIVALDKADKAISEFMFISYIFLRADKVLQVRD